MNCFDDYVFMHTEKKCKDAQGREDKIELHLRLARTLSRQYHQR